jgi:pyridoxine kinase
MSAVTTILSIQSSVAYGYVGNSAATFPLMRMGVEVWPVLTVHFSNHTGYPSWRGPLLTAADIADVVRGIDERGVLGQVDAVLSGYQGAEDVGAVILETVELVRRRNPAVVYCCDPVMGDVGRGFYVRPEIPELMRGRVVPAAQVITPNQFELEALTGQPVRTRSELLAAAEAARALGPETVLVTSVVLADAAPNTIEMVAIGADGAWSVSTPMLPRSFTGGGDLTAATFLDQLLRGAYLASALERTAAVVFGVLRVTDDLGRPELALVAAQQELVVPTARFSATRLA